jgi:tetratricopeptide (TPR) repeat protein
LLESDLRRLPDALKGQEDAARARIKEKMARHLHNAGQHAQAVEAWREVVDIHRSLAQPPQSFSHLAAALRQLGDELSEIGRYDEAEQAYRESIAIFERLHSSREHVEVAAALHGLADALASQARYAEAEQAYKELISSTREIRARTYPTRDRERTQVATALHGLAEVLARQSRHAEAEQANEEAVALGRYGEIGSHEERLILDELSELIRDPATAMLLARKAGFPAGLLPRFPQFASSLAFWTQIAEAARNGLLPGGLQAIIDAAAAMFPGNMIFALARNRSP